MYEYGKLAKLGNENFSDKNYDEAIKFYELALKKDSTRADGYYNLANAFEAKDKLTEAIENF